MTQLDDFEAIIDARSPAEYAEDHLPGAINLPVLDDAERARIGTLHKQDSAFAAKRAGAARVARNIAHHLETHFADRPKDYRPLVYCWRGGNRSGSLTTVLRAVGWPAAQLEGGYKAYRRQVVQALAELPGRLHFQVICGPTGVGKSRLLRALAQTGAQVLDLEALAAHMGSVLGADPRQAQPGQRLFETRVWHHLHRFDPRRPVFVESESRRIGRLHTPEALLARMRASPCLNLSADLTLRVQLLQQDYAHFLADPEGLCAQLDCLTPLRGRARVQAWQALARAGQWDALVAELLIHHYDPAYSRSLARNYPHAGSASCISLPDASADACLLLAQRVSGQRPSSR